MVPIVGYELWSPVKILPGRPLLGEKTISIEPEKYAVITEITVRDSKIYANVYNPFPAEKEIAIHGDHKVVGITDLIGRNTHMKVDSKIALGPFEVKTLILV